MVEKIVEKGEKAGSVIFSNVFQSFQGEGLKTKDCMVEGLTSVAGDEVVSIIQL